jgi:hypothetical protein
MAPHLLRIGTCACYALRSRRCALVPLILDALAFIYDLHLFNHRLSLRRNRIASVISCKKTLQ